jgi:hypothetical protein
MQKSSSVSLSSLKSIFVLASKSLGFVHLIQAYASCCAFSPDVKRMLSLVVHSILMWKECCLMLCTQSWCKKNVIIWPKKCPGFAHPVLCALLPHAVHSVLMWKKTCCLLPIECFSLVHGIIWVHILQRFIFGSLWAV